MNKKIVITGATGLIGKKLTEELINKGYLVTVVSRSIEKAKRLVTGATDYIKWDFTKDRADFVEGKDVVIHLMGENIMAKRWSAEHKKNVFESRINSTRAIINGIEKAKVKPSLFIHASAIGFYGTEKVAVDESSEKGKGFLSDVVAAWEDEAAKVQNQNVRRVSVRLGIILDKEEGALKKMILPFKLFIGGPLGSGQQAFPWIHIDDVVSIFNFAIENTNINGPINAVAPSSINMKEFTSSLGKVLNRPSLFKVPEFILKLILGESASALIKGSKVLPSKLSELNYQFKFANIEDALRDLFQK